MKEGGKEGRGNVLSLAHLGIVPSSRCGPLVRTRDAFEVDDW